MSSRHTHIGPDMRVIDPHHGDITEDVARELAILNKQQADLDYLAVQANQAKIARVCGQESRIGKDGLRLVAQIDASAFGFWELREGREFWKHELAYMSKRHPEIAVRPRFENPTISNPGLPGQTHARIRGKRGRWAA
ncbi:MAG: hypothetical protein ABIO94_11930 [Opitutaceae bacterium]